LFGAVQCKINGEISGLCNRNLEFIIKFVRPVSEIFRHNRSYNLTLQYGIVHCQVAVGGGVLKDFEVISENV